MNATMQQMSQVMEHANMTDQMHMQDMSEIMIDMSDVMKEMAGEMANGQMEPAAIKKLQGRMNDMSQQMDRIEDKAGRRP